MHVILDFLAEGIGQPGKLLDVGPHSEILTLHVAG